MQYACIVGPMGHSILPVLLLLMVRHYALLLQRTKSQDHDGVSIPYDAYGRSMDRNQR